MTNNAKEMIFDILPRLKSGDSYGVQPEMG
jgi:hypothetical protein